MFSALSGKDGTKTTATDLLPFPDATGEKRNRMSDRTSKILGRLYKQAALPPHFFGAVAELLEEAFK